MLAGKHYKSDNSAFSFSIRELMWKRTSQTFPDPHINASAMKPRMTNALLNSGSEVSHLDGRVGSLATCSPTILLFMWWGRLEQRVSHGSYWVGSRSNGGSKGRKPVLGETWYCSSWSRDSIS